jgi:hypothetical protein
MQQPGAFADSCRLGAWLPCPAQLARFAPDPAYNSKCVNISYKCKSARQKPLPLPWKSANNRTCTCEDKCQHNMDRCACCDRTAAVSIPAARGS